MVGLHKDSYYLTIANQAECTETVVTMINELQSAVAQLNYL